LCVFVHGLESLLLWDIITFCVYSLGKEIMGDTFTGTNYHDVRIKP